jgi:ATP-dependent helicase HrpA
VRARRVTWWWRHGSGKTTQLPKSPEAGRGVAGLIGHTQPRRIAAQAAPRASRTSSARARREAVALEVRFTDQSDPASLIR